MATLDDFLDPYQDDEQTAGFGARRSRRSSMPRNSMGRSRFWSPDDALTRQPWFGFPGGREGWLQWRQTGELPLQAGENRARQLTPEQSNYYYKRPWENAEVAAASPGNPTAPAPSGIEGGVMGHQNAAAAAAAALLDRFRR